MVGEEGFTDPPAPDDGTGAAGDAAADDAPETSVRYGDEGVTIMLAKPIPVPGRNGIKTVDRVVLRRPTGADILDIGNPVIFDPGRAQVTHDMQRMPLMIFRLSGIAPPALAKMDPQDLVDCFWAITPFFIPRM